MDPLGEAAGPRDVPAALLHASVHLLAWAKTRWAAFLLAGFSIMAAVIFHNNFSNRSELLFFEKDLAIAGGLLALMAAGGGRWSLDGRRG